MDEPGVHAEQQAAFVWFVEPLEKLIEVLQLDGPAYASSTRLKATPLHA
jgi:hypothetical protein